MNNRIYEAMTAQGLSAYELAKKSGVDKGALSRYLSGKVQPKSKNLHALAVALNVSETWLMRLTDDDHRESDQERIEGKETFEQEMSRRMLEIMINFYKKMTFAQQVEIFERIRKEEEKYETTK